MIVGSLIVALLGVVAVIKRQQRQDLLVEAETKARILLDRNLATHHYFNQRLKPELFRLTDGKRPAEYFDPVWMSSTYAIREIDREFQRINGGGYYYKESAINARTPANEADPVEQEFIEALNRDPKLESRSGIRTIDGKRYFYYLRRGEVMEEGCLRCHSEPARAPVGLVKYYGEERSFHRTMGETISVISIRVPLATALGNANRMTWQLSLLILLILVLVFAVQYWISSRIIMVPLAAIRQKALAIASNDEQVGELIPAAESQELDEVVSAFNAMSIKLRQGMESLEERVHSRTDELQVANVRLTQEVAERQAAEKRVWQLNADLEERVRRRTATLGRVYRELESFNYSVSHDLRGSMQRIEGYGRAILEDCRQELGEKGGHYLDRLFFSLGHMDRVLASMAALSEISGAEIHRQEVDISIMAREILGELQQLPGERQIAISVADGMTAVGDRRLLRMALAALLENARKSIATVPHPSITVAQVSSDKGSIYEVRDNGAGFTEKSMERLFDPISSSASPLEPFGGATLAVARRIISLHGGSITARSLPGQETIFSFTLGEGVGE
jgi:signal transduction histidine kinase